MGQFIGKAVRCAKAVVVALCLLLLVAPPIAFGRSKEKLPDQTGPEWALDGGRRLSYEGSFSSEREVQNKRSFWKKLLEVAIGAPEIRRMVRPYGIVRDSRGRLIVTDPGAGGIHIFDFAQSKYKFLSRSEAARDPLLTPQCVALDDQDNIYVTDSVAGKVFVFDANGKFRHTLGSLKGGEGFFKRPTGIAVDSAAQHIYVTDTLRDGIFVLDFEGNVLQSFGKHGDENGEFNFPTEVLLRGQSLAVVDAMNFRVQFLNRSGAYQSSLGEIGDSTGEMFRPKGIAFDSEDHLYVVDGLANAVQVFDRQGQLLYYFGEGGSGAGQLQLPSGIFIDGEDRVFVVDSYNRRIQIFHYFGAGKGPQGGRQ